MALKIVTPVKHTVGQRAGMTRAKIVANAIKIYRSGKQEFTLQKLAKSLSVATTTIHNHFKGGIDELHKQMARTALSELAPPGKLGQSPKDYLRDLFNVALTKLEGSPKYTRIVLSHLCDNPVLSLVFANRILSALDFFMKEKDVGLGFELVISRLTGFLMMETGAWARMSPKQIEGHAVVAFFKLSATEFPGLKGGKSAVLAIPAQKRTILGYQKAAADRAADTLFIELKNMGS